MLHFKPEISNIPSNVKTMAAGLRRKPPVCQHEIHMWRGTLNVTTGTLSIQLCPTLLDIASNLKETMTSNSIKQYVICLTD